MDSTSQNVVRPIADFPKGISCDLLFESDADQSLANHSKLYALKIELLKEQVKAMVLDTSINNKAKLDIINILDRLGISYKFEKEIGDELKSIFHAYNYQNDFDLYTVSTHFRLFIQHGHKMSSDVFNKFKDNNGKLQNNLKRDVKGILSLYEATHLLMHDERFMSEALDLTTKILRSIASKSNFEDRCLYNQVVHAIKQPLHMGVKRVESAYFISFYEEDESRNETLLRLAKMDFNVLRLAKMDFNVLQLLHRQELNQIVKWWNGLNVGTQLPHVRNRSVECHMWAMTVYYDPFHSSARLLLAKFINMVTIMDDTYDAYGTIEELRLLTRAFERWDENVVDELPRKMKSVFHLVFNMLEDFEEEMPRERKYYVTRYAKKMVLDMFRSYLAEAEWAHQRSIPSFEEYMEASRTTIACQAVTIIFLLGMEATIADEKAFEWVTNPVPRVLRRLELIGRLMNDLVSRQEEKTRGVHVASAVECYAHEHGISEDEAVKALKEMVKDAWKDINEELVNNTSNVSPHILEIPINFARSFHHYYKDTNGYNNSKEALQDGVDLVYSIAFEDI